MKLLQQVKAKWYQLNKCIILFALVSISLSYTDNLNAQTVFWSEDFETDGNGTRYTSANEFKDGAEDYYGRIQNNGGTLQYVGCMPATNVTVDNPYSGQHGSFFMAGEDMDDTGGTCGSPNGADFRNLEFLAVNGHDINITGASEMTFRILVANGADNLCGTATSRWDQGEGLKVIYTKDGGSEVEALCFAPNLECSIPLDVTNEPLHLDLDCDGDGEDGFVNNVFSEYTFTIPAGGNSLELRIWIDADAGDEEIAYDWLRLESVTVPVPVELVKFSGEPTKDGTVELNWLTASEENNKGFDIEYSFDGSIWSTLDFIQGKGTTAELNRYQYTHKQPVAGNNFYRLKQLDYDGAFEHSSVAVVPFRSNQKAINIYPNPFTDKVDITIDNSFEEETIIVVFDLLGNQINSTTLARGATYKNLDLARLNAGTYFIQIESSTGTISKKIIKY